MSADLAELPGSVPVPPGFTIWQVSDLAMLRAWTEVFAPGYGLPPSLAEPFYHLLASFGVDEAVRFYLGYLHGKAVTASTLFLDYGIAGIYNVATLPEARGQGLGAAISLQPLLDAREMGYTLGALQSSEMGFSVYQRLGFKKVCDMKHFYAQAG